MIRFLQQCRDAFRDAGQLRRQFHFELNEYKDALEANQSELAIVYGKLERALELEIKNRPLWRAHDAAQREIIRLRKKHYS